MDSDIERQLRDRIMAELGEKAQGSGVVSREQLSALQVGSETFKLIDRNSGIWNPKGFSATLSIVSSTEGGYSDSESDDGFFHYDYQKGSDAGRNDKLRRAYEQGLPIILLRRLRANLYVPIFPVYVVFDDRDQREFILALHESLRYLENPQVSSQLERRYVRRITRQRLHQAEFRGLILSAYETQCAVCNLRHGKLLDAAHITPDAEDSGFPLVTNGLSMCKIHHSAYDANMLSVSPDYKIHVNSEILQEVDGPMLRHGIQEMNGRALTLPTSIRERPDRDRLEDRFAAFRRGIA